MSVKKTLQNIILGFVPSRKMRHRIRLYMNVDVKKYVEFARRDAGLPNARVKIFQGHGGQKKMIVVLDNRVAYKFVLDASRADGPRREKMFTDAFRDLSPIPLPNMTVLNFNGFDVLKYDFVAGKTVANMDAKTLRKFTPIIAHQLAEFMFAVGGGDPVSLREFKPSVDAKPGCLYGWSHNDMGGNFVVCPDTGKITAFIDWETAAFCDWGRDIIAAHRFFVKHGAPDIIPAALIEYSKLFANR